MKSFVQKRVFGNAVVNGGTGGKAQIQSDSTLTVILRKVCNSEVWSSVGKGLWRNGPVVAPCEISVAMKEFMVPGKRTAEEWLDLGSVRTELER